MKLGVEQQVSLVRDGSNHINIPADTARIDVREHDVVIRNGKLFNLTDRTYEFTATVKADIIYFQDFNDLPEAAKKYITTRRLVCHGIFELLS